MTSRAIDERAMRRALQLATETAGLASPNPQVGCVLVRDGDICAEGAHLYDGRDHAEIVALRQAEAREIDATGATAYVTLEPCSHHGRTAPCADALIAAGVSRVVVGTLDPNPLVRGRGVRRLRGAGVDVTVGVLEAEARALNDGFACSIQTGRPFVTLKTAVSADGYLAPSADHRLPGQPFWLTGPRAREDVQRLRHAADAILTGIGTVLADDPALTDRTGLPRRRPLLRAVLDTHLRISPGSRLLETAEDDLLLLCGEHAPADAVTQLRRRGATVEQLPAGPGGLELEAVLGVLARRSLLSVLLEGGSHLNASFLTQGLVDRVVLYRAPKSLGAGAVPFATGGPTPEAVEAALLRPVRQSFGPDSAVYGYLRDPWRELADTPKQSPER